jgi:single-strand DNA-binding protein
MNKVFLIGNLTRDPEATVTPSGISLCRFSLAVSRRYASSDGTRETDYFNIVVWRAQADNCAKFLKKGSKAAVIGSIQTRSYDKQDGTKGYATDIVAEEVQFLSSRADGSDEPIEGGRTAKTSIASLQTVDEDLPF